MNFKKKTLKLINILKEELKKDQSFIDICEEYDCSPDVVDLVPVKFDSIEVSAKTNKGIIILNTRLLKKDKREIKGYLVHELVHYFQQCYGKKPTTSSDGDDYLDNPYEVEAFQHHIKYIDDHMGEDAAEEYVDKLLDHHDVSNSKEREKKEKTLTKLVD